MSIVLQGFLWTIVILSFFIAHEFYKSKDGRLRVLIIELFVAKMWVYGGAAIYYWFNPSWSPEVVRICLNLPMLFVMLKLWSFIRNKK